MPIFKKAQEKPSVIDPVIDQVIAEMAGYEVGEELFTNAAANLKTLMEAKAVEPKPDRVSLDTVAAVAGSLAGIAMILLFEQNGIITSKSMSLLNRPKI